jgi:hypothetical protein
MIMEKVETHSLNNLGITEEKLEIPQASRRLAEQHSNTGQKLHHKDPSIAVS